MKKYDAYKDSGIEWIGEIPSHWESTRLKFVGESIIGIIYSPDDVVNEGEGLLVLRSSNIQEGRLAFEDCVYVEKEVQEKHLTKEGDILLCARNGSAHLVGKSAYIDKENEGVTFGAFMSIVRSDLEKYLFYFFNSQVFKAQSGLFSTSTINQLTSDTLNNMFISFPKEEQEQTAIAAYLDRKTAEIDELIADKKRLLELYEEEKTAIINQAVTKGLNRDYEGWEDDHDLDNQKEIKPSGKSKKSRFRHSGIEWLGEIPEHWEVKRIDRIANIVRGNTGFKKDELLDAGEYVALQYGKTYKVNEVNDSFCFYVNSEFYKSNQIVQFGDVILISTSETLEDLGHSCFYARNDVGLLGGEQILLRPMDSSVSGKYLFYSSKVFCVQLRKFARGIKVFRFNIDNLKEMYTVIPSIEEQQSIVRHIETECARIDAKKNKTEKLIELLTEYRTALISEVVTGKIKVIP